MNQSDRRVVLVTGGASGIGLAIVRRFLAGGHRVALVARSAEHVERAVSLLDGDRDRLFFPRRSMSRDPAIWLVSSIEFGSVGTRSRSL